MRQPADEAEPEGVLIERFRRGDTDAFASIVLRYRRDVYRICHRMTGSHEDADDMAQETFVRAHGALPKFRGESSLKTWLFRIAINLSINLARTRGASRPLEDAGAVPSDPPRGETNLLARERARRVRRAVDGLPPRQRQVVVLRMYEELQFREIAELLECPIGTVKANFFHAMKNLRKALA